LIPALALMEMESLDGINLFFLGLKERPEEAPCSTIGKKVYDGELVKDSGKLLLNFCPSASLGVEFVKDHNIGFLKWFLGRKNKFTFNTIINFK
jgi:hypothetical protein